MSQQVTKDFHLGEWIVRPLRRIIERGGESVHIMPKPMFVLECLASANGAPVSRNKLFDTVWPGGEVSDDTLTRCVVELRKAFGDSARDSHVIETIPKLGFRLLLPVEPLKEEPLAVTRSSPESPRPHRGVAVLPFVNLSSDTQNEYFSDGMSEEILNALASTNHVPVIARTSSFQFKGQNRDAREIGRLLVVSHLLEGSVLKVDQRIRVTAQLIDTATGTHVWSEVYQRELSDIFALQDEITHRIVEQVDLALCDDLAPLKPDRPMAEPGMDRRTTNLEAYDLYLKGMQLLASTNPISIEQAAGFFDRSIALDEEYAAAWAAKGRALHVLSRPSYGSQHIPASVYPGAIAAYRRALEIEPDHAFAMGWLGVALMLNDFQWAEGMALLKQSLANNPNDAVLLSVYGSNMKNMHLEGADDVLDRAYRLDPYGIVPIAIRAISLQLDGRPLDALAVIETSLIDDRDGYAPNHYAALFNLLAGRLVTAEAHLGKARLVAHPADLSLDVLGWIIDNWRGKVPLPWAEIWARAQTEFLDYLMFIGLLVEWEDAEAMVKAFDLAIEQRHHEVLSALSGPKPPLLPEADWRRMQEVTGVAEFQAGR